ncbi:hypothetical protein [Candidatus Albibeggiatoa sp. nov. NOAA]|uniref:hypothetical protein n=1 Tax=Candidatus Albibeggiatoa sp. nov. NOAA TaxID=3162724 RepID=UPI0032F54F14|nr:hypothetical protein [Thiotrichaceae bacterium]
MRILFYSLCVLPLLSCGQKGDLVRPQSAKDKLIDAISTPATHRETTIINITPPVTRVTEEPDEQTFDVIDSDVAITLE